MAFQDIIKAIKSGSTEPIYTLYGNERYLIDQVVQHLKSAVVSPDYADFNEQVIDAGKTDFQTILNGFETLPFFSDKRLMIVKNVEWFGSNAKSALSEHEEEQLMSYINNPSFTTVVVLIAESVDKRKRPVKALQKTSGFSEMGKLDAVTFKKLVLSEFKKYGTDILPEAVDYLLFNLGYLEKDSTKDLYAVIHQLELLSGYCQGKAIDKASIDKIIEKPLDTNIFAFLDAVSDGKTGESVKIKDQLLADGLNDIQINSMLYKQMRNLYKTTLLLKKGYSPNQVAEKLGVHPFSAKKYVAQCRAFQPNYLEKVVIQMAELDYRMKTGRIGFGEALDLMSVCLSKRLPLL